MRHWPKVTIYTDGACKGDKVGGWGAILVSKFHHKMIRGGELVTTNNRMELTAAIEALKTLKMSCDVKLYTDSKYVQQGAGEWMAGWKKRDWKTVKGGPVKNADLWMEMDEAIQDHDIELIWVKGHSGVLGNELADALANEGVEDIRNGIN